MILELAIAILFGVLAGTISGTIPGIHINLISAIMVSQIDKIPFSPIGSVIFIASLAITHTFLDFIPSIYLGAPEEDTFLAVLPGHELLAQGKAHEAVIIALLGSLTGLAIIIFLAPIFIYIAPFLDRILKNFIPFILIFISTYLLLRENNHFTSLAVFLMSGMLGILALNLPVKEPLLPLLTGLFGTSSIILSLKNKTQIPQQNLTPLTKTSLTKEDVKKATVSAAISIPFCSFLPALGSGYSSLISSELIPQTRRGFIFLNGILNTVIMTLSFTLVYAIGKSRTGAAAATKEILSKISLSDITLIIISIIIAGTLAFIVGIRISIITSKILNKINYKKISLGVLILLITIIALFSNSLGMLVFVTSTCIGIFAIESGVRRTNLMGALLIPTIILYLI